MKFCKGFTLIELMITLSIAGILLGYSIPSFNQLKLNKFMEAERNRLTASLNFARYHAINHQTYVVVCPSLTGQKCDNQSNWFDGWMVFTDINKNRKLDHKDTLLRYEDAMRHEIKATSSIHRQKVRYNAMGFSPGTNLSINFCDARGKDFAKSIILNNAGRVKQSQPISNNICN